MIVKEFVLKAFNDLPSEGKITYKAPSNIALVKYWGKKEHQIPANPSISFTLDHCATTTTVTYKKLLKDSDFFSFDLLFEGAEKPAFRPKIETFLERIFVYLPYLKSYHFTIETSNSFPHSSGIASSASGMAALALCLLHIEKEGTSKTTAFFDEKASFLARLGSGSACRSISGPLMQWGAHDTTENSTDLYAVTYNTNIHAKFENFQDTILLVDKGQKQVSSTVGHNLMHNHPFAAQRFEQAHTNLTLLQKALSCGDLKTFIEIVESEALTLHAMMMTSMPYFILMKPNTLQIIEKIWAFRVASNTHVCFTLDAGANVHVLYPASEKEIVFQFIKDELVGYCENGQYICDRIGMGAKKV